MVYLPLQEEDYYSLNSWATLFDHFWNYFQRDPLAVLANVLQVVGFVVTLGVFRETRNLKRRYLSGIMVPSLKERIGHLNLQLRTNLNDPGQLSVGVVDTLVQIEANLDELRAYLEGIARKRTTSVLREIQLYRAAGGQTQERGWEIYHNCLYILRRLDQMEEKRRWPS
jgi:hypothetical protein